MPKPIVRHFGVSELLKAIELLPIALAAKCGLECSEPSAVLQLRELLLQVRACTATATSVRVPITSVVHLTTSAHHQLALPDIRRIHRWSLQAPACSSGDASPLLLRYQPGLSEEVLGLHTLHLVKATQVRSLHLLRSRLQEGFEFPCTD